MLPKTMRHDKKAGHYYTKHTTTNMDKEFTKSVKSPGLRNSSRNLAIQNEQKMNFEPNNRLLKALERSSIPLQPKHPHQAQRRKQPGSPLISTSPTPSTTPQHAPHISLLHPRHPKKSEDQTPQFPGQATVEKVRNQFGIPLAHAAPINHNHPFFDQVV